MTFLAEIPKEQARTVVNQSLATLLKPVSSAECAMGGTDVIPAGVTQRLAPPTLNLHASLPQGRAQVTVLAVEGVLNRHTYEALIDAARDLYARNRRALLIDLRKLTQIELSGLFALHSIAHLYTGGALLNPELGWPVLQVATHNSRPEMSRRVKLLLSQPAVRKMIRRTSFCRFFEIYDDLDSAIAAFNDEEGCPSDETKQNQ